MGALTPDVESSKRIKAVQKYYNDPEAQAAVRQACLCLRLTLYATSLTAQKHARDSEENNVPTLVKLGRGDVQSRTSILFAEIVENLANDPRVRLRDTFANLDAMTGRGHQLPPRSCQHVCVSPLSRMAGVLWRARRKKKPGRQVAANRARDAEKIGKKQTDHRPDARIHVESMSNPCQIHVESMSNPCRTGGPLP